MEVDRACSACGELNPCFKCCLKENKAKWMLSQMHFLCLLNLQLFVKPCAYRLTEQPEPLLHTNSRYISRALRVMRLPSAPIHLFRNSITEALVTKIIWTSYYHNTRYNRQFIQCFFVAYHHSFVKKCCYILCCLAQEDFTNRILR